MLTAINLLHVQDLVQPLAGLGADGLEHGAALADDDRLLRVALHPDHGVDADQAALLAPVRLVELLDLDLHINDAEFAETAARKLLALMR